MAPPPTGPLASRVPPTGPKARSSSTSSASPVIANASTSVPIPVATPLGRHASGGFASSGYGYDRQRAALLTGGSSGQRGRGRPFARGNGMMHPHAPHGQAGPGMPHQVPVPGMGHTFPVPVGMAYQQQQQQMAYTNGYAHYAHTHQQYGFQGQGQGQGQYMDPSMVAGPSTAPYVPPTPTQPSHKATAPRPPSRPATPPPPPPPPEEDDVPDSARIAEVRSPVKITLPRLKEKDKPSKATAQAKSTPMDKAKDTEKGKGKGGGSERQVEFLPRDDTHRSPISITFAATSKAKPKPAQIDLDAAPVMRESNVAATSPRADRRPRTPSPGAPGTPPPDTPPPPTPPPPPPSEPPSSPAIPTSPRAMKKPPTSPRPAPPRIPPPPPPTVDEPPPAPPPAPPPVPPEPKRPPSSPRSRPPSLTRVVAAALPLPVPAVSVAERRSSKWDVPPDAVPSANGVKEEVVPPVVHFRQMPAALVAERINGHGVTVQEEEQDDDEEDDDDDDDDEEDDSPMEQPASSWSREMPPHRQLPPHMATAPPAEAPPPPPPVAPKSPTPPPPPPPEPPWQPPAWFFRRTAGSYLVTLSSDGRKEVSRRTDGMVDGVPVQVVDPRTETKGPEGKGTAKVVQAYRQVTYPWGPLSVGPKPAEPATAVLITGLSPLTTADQIRTFLRPHGRIRELDAKFDPKSGMQLGICWVKFDGPAGSASSIGSGAGRKGATGAGSNAHDVAVAVVKACNGHRVGMTSTERVTVVLDGEGKKAVKAVKEEMEKRYPKPKPIAVAPVPPPKPASVSTMPPPVGTPTSGSGAGTPRPNGVGKLPIPVAVKLHAQAKAEYRTPSRSLPFAPAPKYTPQPAVHSTSNLPTGLPARPLPAGLPARPATQSFTSSFVDAPFDKYDRYDKLDRDRDRERSRKTDRDGGRDRDTYGSRRTTDTYLARSRSRSRSRSYSRSPSRSRFRSRSRSRSLSTDYTSDSDSDSDSYRRRRYHSPASRRDSHMHTHRGKDTYIPRREVKKAGVDDDDKTREELDKNGKAAVWIDKAVLATTQQNEVHLWDHFRNFRPENILRAPTGFYVLFSDHSSAERAKFLDGSLMHGIKISLVIKTAHVKHDPSQAQIPGQGLGQAQAQKSWQSMTIGKKKPVKPVAKVVSPKVVKKAAGAKVDDVRMVKGVKRSSPSKGREGREVKRRIVYTSDEDEEEYDEAAPAPTVKTSTPVKLVAAAPVESVRPSSPARTSDDVDMEGESEIEPDREPEIAPATQVETAAPTKKRPAAKATPAPAPAAKKAKKGKKARIESPAPLIPPTEIVEPPVAEIKLDELAPAPESAALAAKSTETAAAGPDEPKLPKGSKVPKATKVPKVPKAGTAKSARGKKAGMTPLERFIEDEQVVDEEDAYWLSRALALPEGETSDVEDDDAEMDPLVPEDHPLHHTSGAWRVEGLRKVPPALKSAYLPQRNRAQAAAEDASALGGGLTTGRTARASGRRLALDMETHRKTLVHGTGSRDAAASAAAAAAATAENDIFAFNQLRIRKKQLRFARSAIEGYGLYAMETIQPGEMVCEYVGELVRSSVADLREAKYLKQGIGSSYLFRIDADVVCDATFRGSVSRLINHSCDPSASAKIISINGQSKIVIYAKRLLSPGEEILYDYKFPLESDPALRVPCLCGSKICRGFLN